MLFPAVEAHGVDGPTHVMVLEHADLRRYKKAVQDLANQAKELDFAVLKKRIDGNVKMLTLTLRDHIFKENNILYPTSIEVIKDTEEWERIKSGCDKVGYCKFTPRNG